VSNHAVFEVFQGLPFSLAHFKTYLLISYEQPLSLSHFNPSRCPLPVLQEHPFTSAMWGIYGHYISPGSSLDVPLALK